jgi:NhaP-type Na+/H+ or K+/H+ antiporter
VEWSLAIVAAAVLLVAAFSRALVGTPVTTAMVFVSLGLLLSPKALDGVDLSSTNSGVRTLAEAALTLVLFCDAARVDLRVLRREVGIPVRLLGIELPLTIALGALMAALIFDQLTLGEAVILGVILAPTDAALGQAVVTDRRIPPRIRQGLNVESGLNDGICVPLLFAAIATADIESDISNGHRAITLLAEEIGYGLLGGAIAAVFMAGIFTLAGRRNLIASAWMRVIPVAGAALAYGLAAPLDGSGFIAAFTGGLIFRALIGKDPAEENALAEELGNVLSGVTFFLFGAILLGPALSDTSWQIVLYALLSVTVVRVLPVFVAMIGVGARAPTLAFLGWFGPRGLASIVFAVILIQESQLPEEQLLTVAIYLTVGLSVFAHGVSAAPLARRYGRWYEAHPPGQAPGVESAPAKVTRTRHAAGLEGRAKRSLM